MLIVFWLLSTKLLCIYEAQFRLNVSLGGLYALAIFSTSPCALALAVKSGVDGLFETLAPGYTMLMSPNKEETAVHGWHCTGR